MEYAIGIAAAAAVGLFGTVIGFDKERSFYPVVLIVIATLYLLFAVMAKSTGCHRRLSWVESPSLSR